MHTHGFSSVIAGTIHNLYITYLLIGSYIAVGILTLHNLEKTKKYCNLHLCFGFPIPHYIDWNTISFFIEIYLFLSCLLQPGTVSALRSETQINIV